MFLGSLPHWVDFLGGFAYNNENNAFANAKEKDDGAHEKDRDVWTAAVFNGVVPVYGRLRRKHVFRGFGYGSLGGYFPNRNAKTDGGGTNYGRTRKQIDACTI